MTTTATIREMAVAELQNEAAAALFREHYDEIALDKECKLDPNWDTFYQLEAAGVLLVLGVYDGDQLIGYTCTSISPHAHYKATIVAQNHSLFLSKEHRGGRLGLRLMCETEKIATERGAHMMVWHAKEGTRLSKMLAKTHSVLDVLYTRRLGA